MIHFYKSDKRYSQALLEECKYIVKDSVIKIFFSEDLTDLSDSEIVSEND